MLDQNGGLKAEEPAPVVATVFYRAYAGRQICTGTRWPGCRMLNCAISEMTPGVSFGEVYTVPSGSGVERREGNGVGFGPHCNEGAEHRQCATWQSDHAHAGFDGKALAAGDDHLSLEVVW